MPISVSAHGLLTVNGKEFRCALGRGGVTSHKKEGDGATPAGCFPIRELMYRADRVTVPPTDIPTSHIQENQGWCDDPSDPLYNKKVTLPYEARHEKLWREDALYDVVLVLGYNDDPVVAQNGSAIFIHRATPDYQATDGCIALSLLDLLDLIPEIHSTTTVCIATSHETTT
jgi:L,D-peptidoglycan transpeptidase YkuD (ErfK/YbiS/YcfS/YnhG family)